MFSAELSGMQKMPRFQYGPQGWPTQADRGWGCPAQSDGIAPLAKGGF